jgi:hypothetical protein
MAPFSLRGICFSCGDRIAALPSEVYRPGGPAFSPAFAVITLIAFLGYRYLRKAREDAA